MKTTIWGCIALILFAAGAVAQPAITAVLDGAAYTEGIPQGAVFVVKGTNLSAAGFVSAPAPSYPKSLNNVSITLTPAAGGADLQPYMVYTYNQGGVNQLAAVMPSTVATGSYNLKVTNGGATSAAFKTSVVARKPGIVTAAGSGAGPAQATLAGALILQRFSPAGKIGDFDTRPAKAGERVDLWGTGLGADTASDTGGTNGDQTAAASVRVLVNGVEVTPLYAGRSQGYPGLDQIVFTLPANVTPSCFVSVQVRAGGSTGNISTIAVAAPPNTSCTHPTLSETQLKTLSQGGTITGGAFVVASSGVEMPAITVGPITIPGSTNYAETIGGAFSRYGQDAIGTAEFSAVADGPCTVWKRVGTVTELTLGTAPTPLDAGSPLVASLPGGTTVNLLKTGNTNFYNATLGSTTNPTKTLQAGVYRLQGPGGTQVGAFGPVSTIVPSFDWTNRASITAVNRSQGLAINWSGGSPGWVEITGFAGNYTAGGVSAANPNPTVDAAGFVCISRASANTFTVPASVLQQLPAATMNFSDPNALGVGMLSVFAVSDGTQGTFSAPVVGGGTLDYGIFTYAVGNSKFLSYQ